MEKKSFYSFTLNQLVEKLVDNGFKAFQARQLFHWVYQKSILSIDDWSNISKDLKYFVKENFDLALPRIVWEGLSKDGTRKFLIRFFYTRSYKKTYIYRINFIFFHIISLV